MTMFNRGDKAIDTGAGVRPPPRERVETPVAPPPDAKRPQATAQPIAAIGSVHEQAISIISRSLKITGQLESSENIQIDGEVDGDVRAVLVKVGSSARIKGTVSGEEVELAGTVDGKIEAKKVLLTSTAHMSGDVIHQNITVESGAFIDGHCRPEFGKVGAKPVSTISNRIAPARDPAVAVKQDHSDA
jgi:cytoskeletal protein CcmA (bactofilin family)